MPNWNDIPFKKSSGSEYTTCPNCSADRKKKTDKCLSIDHDTGRYTCNHCSWSGWRDTDNKEKTEVVEKQKEYVRPEFNNRTELPEGVVQWFMKRALKQETINHFKVNYGNEWMPQKKKETPTIQYPYIKNGLPINIKYKTPDKCFKMYKDAEKTLFNIDSIKGYKEMLICEGEEEAMSWHQAGYKQVVSIPNGAVIGNNNLDYLSVVWDEFLADKTKVYIATDNDQAGKKLAEDLISRFGKDICYQIEYKHKDANDDLKYEGEEFLISHLKNAKGFPIDGVFFAEDMEDELWNMYNDKDFFPRGTTTYVESLDPHFTWRKGDYTTVYGPGNQGKTTFLLMLCVLKSMHEGDVWGIFTPEQNPPYEFFIDLIHTYIGKSADPNFTTLQMNKAEFQKGIDFVKKHFIYVYPDQYQDRDTLFSVFKNIIVKKNVTGIIIDPINQVERLDTDAKIRDDQYISRFAIQFKRFILNHNVYGIVVTHGKIRFDEKTRVAQVPNMYKDIEGGEMTARKTDNIIAYWRPNFAINISDSQCIVFPQKIKKQKLTGMPGQVEFTYDKKTNRYYDFHANCSFTKTVIKDKQILIPLKDAVTNIGDSEADDFFGMPDEDPFK